MLCADAQGTSSELGLCDGFNFGATTVHYEVEVVDPRRRPRGLGDFSEVRSQPRREVYLRTETLPGEQAQIDWAYVGR